MPDLAIEVIFSSGNTNDLQKYQKLGVEEVWFWLDDQLEIYVLTGDVYQKQQLSLNLPKISDGLLTKYIAQALTGNPRILKKSFVAEVD